MSWFSEEMSQKDCIVSTMSLTGGLLYQLVADLHSVFIALKCYQEPNTKAVISISLRREVRPGCSLTVWPVQGCMLLSKTFRHSFCAVLGLCFFFLSSCLPSSSQCVVIQSVCQSQPYLPRPVSPEEFCTDASCQLPAPNVHQSRQNKM